MYKELPLVLCDDKGKSSYSGVKTSGTLADVPQAVTYKLYNRRMGGVLLVPYAKAKATCYLIENIPNKVIECALS